MRNLIFVARGLAIAAVAAVLLSGCGGGSSGGSGGSTSSVSAQGVYFGSYTVSGVQGKVSVFGAILANGYAYFGDSQGALYVLPSGIKSGSFGGALKAYAPIGQVFANGQNIVTFSLSGNAAASGGDVTSISGAFSGAGESGTFNIGYQNVSQNTVSLSALVGTWQGYYWGSGSTSISLTVNSDGTFSGNDGLGCSITGRVSVVAGSDLVKANATSSGNSNCVGAVTGLGFVDNSDLGGFFGNANGTYLYFGASNPNAGFVAELYK